MINIVGMTTDQSARTSARIFILFGILTALGGCSSPGGRCYSASQLNCEVSWSKLWEASYRRENNNICQYFHEIHKCTLAYQNQCPFGKVEEDLYNKDILQIYTKPPYSCTLIGGNMRQRAEQAPPTAAACHISQSAAVTSLYTLLALVTVTLTLKP